MPDKIYKFTDPTLLLKKVESKGIIEYHLSNDNFDKVDIHVKYIHEIQREAFKLTGKMPQLLEYD